MKAKHKMAGQYEHHKRTSINSMRWEARDRDRLRSAIVVVDMGRTLIDGTR